MPRILEITIPPDRTAAVLAQIEATQGWIGYRVEPRASNQPAGDVVTLTTTNRSLHPLLRSLEHLLDGSGWSIAINEPAGLIAPASRRDIDNDDNEVTWEEMDFTILRESNMTINSLLVMTTSGVLAATGITIGALHLVIAAMVIAPGFEPINRVSLDLVSGSGAWHRGISDVLKGYAALFGGAVLAAFVLSAAGRSLQAGGTYLSTSDLVSFWTQPTVPSLMVTAFAAAAGAVLIASNRSVLTAGVMIALALVPPVAIAGLALVGGDATLEGKVLVQWVVEVLIVAAGGAAVFVWPGRAAAEGISLSACASSQDRSLGVARPNARRPRARVKGERALIASRAIRGFVFALLSRRVPTAYQGGTAMATRFDPQIHEQREATEGPATRGMESVTARLPSGAYLTAAISAMAGSAVLQAIGKQGLSLFVGQWAPSILIMGLYNKLVKVAGSD